MSVVRSKLALMSQRPQLHNQIKDYEPVLIDTKSLAENDYRVDLLFLDSAELKKPFEQTIFQKLNRQFFKIILVLQKGEQINLSTFENINVSDSVFIEQIGSDYLQQLWQDLQQQEQDETYISLSTELNQQYEMIKAELESKLNEKSKNIIESRKQIFEINNRVEVLRKSLYSTTEVKSLQEAEGALNDLLVKFGMLTWFKIVKQSDAKQFENDIKSQFESTLYSNQMNIKNEVFYLFFFKGDKRPFRKADLNYFNKLAEALQINLNRYNNLLELQKNERLFDLAFHSSPHPIIVIDKNYNVYQSNLAAEKNAAEGEENLKCYQLLFGQKKPCIGCQLGAKFEIQKEFSTYAVQSNKFSNSLDTENNYWIHLYEDISEQKALESKFQQTAKLSEVGLISSSIAHELNNPLGGILSYLQIMKMELPAEHPFQDDLRFLTEAALRMKKHIEDLLFFSRKEDTVKLERVEMHEVLHKNLDLLQMQLKKEHLVVSFVQEDRMHYHEVSILHFRNIIHLVFQFFLHKLRIKRQNKANFSGLVEVKVSQDQSGSYLSFNSNLGPHDLKLNSNDLSLITLEKSILDQGFQLVISEPQNGWLQLLIKLPLK
jgi:two-component system, NtrC family, sensor kinase